MELLPGLLALQLTVMAAGFAWLWSRQQRLNGELERLQHAYQELEARVATRARRARAGERGAVIPIGKDKETAPAGSPLARAARAWQLRTQEPMDAVAGPVLSPDTARGLTLALMATLPAFGLFFGADEAALASTGLAIAAAMMLIALRKSWSAAAWSAVLTAAAWALIGFARGAAHAEPQSYAICVALAAGAGLMHARLRDATSGAAMAFTMGAAALTLASQTGMVGPAGAAFAAIVACAAVVGATSLRLESLHLAAFVGSLIGLFVLSGQDSAAILFTPAAALVGALFFAIAAIRVPQLGARGATLAGTGALAPFAAVAALYAAQHGLADRMAAAAAYGALALLLGWLVSAAAHRDRAVAPLGLTLWVLTLGAFAAASNAIVLALPSPAAAPAFAALGLALALLNLRIPDAAWRICACSAGVLAALFAAISAQLFLTEAPGWPGYIVLAAGVLAPALISGASVAAAARAKAAATAGFFEALVIVLGVAFASLVVRLYFSGGATLLQPIGLAEAGAHSAVWLAAALLLGVRPHEGDRKVRPIAVHALSVMGLAGVLAAASHWTITFMDAPPALGTAAKDAIGFLLPGVLFWAHWVFWRARGAELQTRVSLAAGAVLMAAALTLATVHASRVPEWVEALVGALSFALAMGVNFAPGVVGAESAARLDLEEDLHRDGRRQQRGQARHRPL